MSLQTLEPPASDELEISLFGPGYGEAICLHIGGGKWVIVDSCLQPKTSEPAPLSYLTHIGVDVGHAVKLIVASHWHDDHVRGISKIVEICESAEFAMPQALSVQAFFELVELYSKSAVMDHIQAGVDEIGSVFRLLQRRRQRNVRFNSPLLAAADRILLRTPIALGKSSVEATIAALSPSDEDHMQAILAFGALLPQYRQAKRRVASPSPNHASVVLRCQVGQHRLLLGSDLERSNNPQAGWSAILTRSQLTNGQAELFKIPHHGSATGHDDGVWSNLLISDPVGLLSPYQRGRQSLPTPADIARIISLTPNAYITALPPSGRPSEWRNRVVRESIRQATKTLQALDGGWGHIRARQKIADPPGMWDIYLAGDAQHLRRSGERS